jgi:hypothetical protein
MSPGDVPTDIEGHQSPVKKQKRKRRQSRHTKKAVKVVAAKEKSPELLYDSFEDFPGSGKRINVTIRNIYF